MILSLSASSRPTIIPTTIPSPRSGGVFSTGSKGCSSRCCCWPGEAGVLKLGTVALDGTKVHANASWHSALSWKHACELEARLKAEVAELMALAEAADGADVPDGMSVPEELARREDRLARIAEAKAVIEARARERLERERAEYEAKLEARAEKAEKTGRKPGGRPPEPPVAGPGPKDQVNLTDADSRIMPVAGGVLRTGLQRPSPGGGRQPAGGHQRRGPGPQRQAANRAGAGSARPPSRGAGRARDPAGSDSGYFSEANVNACAEAEIAPLITPGRELGIISPRRTASPARRRPRRTRRRWKR